MEGFFDNTEEFLELFDFANTEEFYDPVVLKDSKVGFSVKSHYPQEIRYRPAIYSDGSPDNIVAIWVIYEHPDESRESIKSSKVPLRVRVSNMSLYRQKHWDYDFDDEEAPTEESVEISSKTPQPLEISFSDDFFFDHKNNQIIDRKGKTLTPIEMLERVKSVHVNTVHLVKGIRIQFKIGIKEFLVSLLTTCIDFLSSILKKIFARTLDQSAEYDSYFKGFRKSDFKKLDQDSINLFGYKAGRPVIILFSCIVVAMSYLRYRFEMEGGYVSFVTQSALSSALHGLIVIWILDSVVPNILFWFLNKLIRARFTLMLRRIKVP